MDILKFPLRLLRRAKSKPQTYILQLPVEILLEIFEYLPPYSQLLVYQACRPLRTLVHQYFLAGKGNVLATLEDKLRYLTHLARSTPDRWVCAKCCKLHQTCKWDTPVYRGAYQLPACRDGIAYVPHDSECQTLSNVGYSASHRHIELTLKYSRLKSKKKKHRTHLQRLLAPHHFETQSPRSISVAEGILAQSSFYPKVVDGRYLLHTVRTYLGAETPVSPRSIKFLQICPHLHSLGGFCRWNNMGIDLDTVFNMAFSAPPNTPIFSSCPACGTDISIQFSPERAVVCAWQDVGPEATVYDPDWEAIVRRTKVVYHDAGSIRELFGQHEHNGEIF
ncbi:hypothetical protein TRIATDRAFT_43205 [Trichoderma atroviride IMI 206040]|uniref:F-box domain-containing protein n=1 Tax=Hypocrea atroviridis (strain ATCC 20476 / IMI 206040) TaxID=452589 RepID=G9NSZ1_HYPAI|nr:uncharacterized protein TRIATDRAFT_43205 [Trichoderma atroviride IMI 206040]EHK46535.1 hypothetical protein TRIATDRAFT_43205 [Trichoderma atroviride IMI 206040]